MYADSVLVSLEYTNSCGWKQLQNVNASGIHIGKGEELESQLQRLETTCRHKLVSLEQMLFPQGVFQKPC